MGERDTWMTARDVRLEPNGSQLKLAEIGHGPPGAWG